MKVSVSKSKVRGDIKVPSSKSYTLRALMAAALAKGESEIIHPLRSGDTEVAWDVLTKVGVRINQKGDSWHVSGGNFHKPNSALFCSESAATLRFMAAICSLIPGECRLTASPSLSQRPIKPLVQALRQLGVDCTCKDDGAPIVVKGGKLRGGVTELPGNVSSQFVSALLFISPFAEAGMKIRLTTPLESKPYVLMTLECLKSFGIKVDYSEDFREFEVTRQAYKPTKYKVEGDWSSASYLLALGAMTGEVTVRNLNLESWQGDKRILNFLREMGAPIETDQDSVTVRKSRLKAIRADLSDSIDLLPTMAVLAAVAEGVSEFVGIKRARLKESNRVLALKEGLKRMNIPVGEETNRLVIYGGIPEGAFINSHHDHRIAMAFGVLGSFCGDTIINDAECVSKTFPEFWDVLISIGGEVVIDGE